MKTRLLTFIIAFIFIMTGSAWAYGFKYGDLYYEITDETNRTVRVTFERFERYMDTDNYSSLSGSVTIPEIVIYSGKQYRVTTISNWAFFQCRTLTQITIPSSVTNIESDAFYRCSKLKEINVESGNTTYCSEDGVLFNKDKNILIQYPNGKENTSYTIPNNVTNIGEFAFSFCNTLKEINVENGNTAYCSEDGYYSIKIKTY